MDVKRLPPSLLVALGLAGCGPTVEMPAGETDTDSGGSLDGPTTTACLICPPDGCDDVTTGPCLAEAEVSACLSPPGTTDITTTGPCLSTDATFISPDTESSSGSGSGTDTDTDGSGSGSGSTSAGDPDGDRPGERARTLQHLLDAGILPPDLAARLRGGGSGQ